MFPKEHFLLFLSFFLWLLCWQRVSYVNAQFASNNNFWPASWPLAVRSPYLNSWVDTPNGTANMNRWPLHWDLASIMGWSGSVRVDGNGFNWLGDTGNASILESAAITPTRTTFITRAGNVRLNTTFLSPIEPGDLVKQSFPFAYLSVSVSSVDGLPHNVQLYSDISAEWVSGDRASLATWNTTVTSNSVFHTAFRSAGVSFQEIANVAEDSLVYYAAQNGPGITWQSGADADVRGQFATQGKLKNTADVQFRAIQDHFPVFAIAADLGAITTSAAPIVWSIGMVRDPVAQYAGVGGGKQVRRSYFWTKYNSISNAIDDFVTDFPKASQRSAALDSKILADANKVSANYADLVSIGIRQVMGSMDITVGQKSDGSLDANDVKAFMRDMGVGRRVNPVETLYAAFPTLMYLNPIYGRLLLDPLLQYQSQSLYPNQFAAPDLGPSYPSAMGNNDPTGTQGVEDSGNMLLMTWAHATFSGDGVLISNYYDRLKSYADYLVPNALAPNGQLMDGLSKANMTNLALKGILGIRAMGSISQAAKKTNDAKNYTSISTSYIKQWTGFASSNGHLLSSYTPTSSFGLIYNLFADLWLNFRIVGSDVYAAQTSFYATQSQSSTAQFGLPFDGSGPFAKSHWTLFAAAACTDLTTRTTLINQVHNRASFNVTNAQIGSLGAFPAQYDVGTGKAQSGQASAAQGAMLAPIALGLSQSSTINLPAPTTKSLAKAGGGLAVGAIVGIVIGIVVVLILLGLILFLWLRKRRDRKQQLFIGGETSMAPPPTPGSFISGGGNGVPSPILAPMRNAQAGGSQYQPSEYQQSYQPYQHHQHPSTSTGNISAYQQNINPAGYGIPPNAMSEQTFSSNGSGVVRNISLGPGGQAGPGSPTDVYDTAYSYNAYSRAASERSGSQPGARQSVATSTSNSRSGGGAGSSSGRTKGESEWSVHNRNQSGDLRNEVENLRREMNQLKYELQPPPEYG